MAVIQREQEFQWASTAMNPKVGGITQLVVNSMALNASNKFPNTFPVSMKRRMEKYLIAKNEFGKVVKQRLSA